MAKQRKRDVEQMFPAAEFIRQLRRFADSIERGHRFGVEVAGELVPIPAHAVFSIEHERASKDEEIEFQVKWVLEPARPDGAGKQAARKAGATAKKPAAGRHAASIAKTTSDKSGRGTPAQRPSKRNAKPASKRATTAGAKRVAKPAAKRTTTASPKRVAKAAAKRTTKAGTRRASRPVAEP